MLTVYTRFDWGFAIIIGLAIGIFYTNNFPHDWGATPIALEFHPDHCDLCCTQLAALRDNEIAKEPDHFHVWNKGKGVPPGFTTHGILQPANLVNPLGTTHEEL